MTPPSGGHDRASASASALLEVDAGSNLQHVVPLPRYIPGFVLPTRTREGIGLVLFGVSSCQNKSASQQVLSYSSKNNCEFRFEGVGLTLIENHCGSTAGMYFMTPQGLHTAPLIDPKVSALIQQHGCDAPNQCTFNLEMNTRTITGQFDYTINGKEGFYSFEWPRDDQPRLVESSNTPNES